MLDKEHSILTSLSAWKADVGSETKLMENDLSKVKRNVPKDEDDDDMLNAEDLKGIKCELQRIESEVVRVRSTEPEWDVDLSEAESYILSSFGEAFNAIAGFNFTESKLKKDLCQNYSNVMPAIRRNASDLASGFNGMGLWAIAVSQHADESRVFISDQHNHMIHVLDSNLRPTGLSFGTPGNRSKQFNKPRGIAFNSINSLFIADSGNHRIQVVSKNGKFRYMFGMKGSDAGMLNEPGGICIDEQDRVYVCDRKNYRIQVFKLDGTFLWTFGNKDLFKTSPFDITITKDNNIVVSDLSGNLHILSSHGEPTKLILSNTLFAKTRGIAVDKQNNIVLADQGSSKIVTLTPDGTQCLSDIPIDIQGYVGIGLTAVYLSEAQDFMLVTTWEPDAVQKLVFK